MSDAAIAKECLHHYDNRHIQVRWDFFELCAYDKAQFNNKLNKNGKIIKDEPNQECMAKILRILETLTDHEKTKWYMEAKRLEESGLTPPPEPREFPIQLSYGAICSLLYGTYGESTVRNSVAFLLHRSLIKQYQQTKNSIPFYVLKTQNLQKALKDQAERSLSGVEINSQDGDHFQVLKSTAKRLNSTPKSLKSTAKPLISKGSGVEINNNNNSNNLNNDNKQKEDSIVDLSSDEINASHTSLSDLSDEDLLAELQRRKFSSKQEPSGDTNVPNTPSPISSTRSSTTSSSDIRDNSSTEHADTSLSPHGMEDIKDVEQVSIQDKQSNPIATGNTNKEEEKSIVGELAIREVEQVTLFSEVNIPNSSTNKRRTRKSKQELSEKQTSMKSRVKAFCEAFKSIGVEVFDDPDFYVRTPSVKEDLYDVIVDLIESKASQEQMKLVFMEFWDEKGQDGKYWWRDPSHLTLKAMCKNFGTRLASAKFKTRQAEKKQVTEKKQPNTSQPTEQDLQNMSLAERNAYYAARYSKSSSSNVKPSNVTKFPAAIAR